MNFLPLTSYSGPGSRSTDQPLVFGMRLSTLGVKDVADLISSGCLPSQHPARLFVTPNIQHIAEMRSNEPLRAAMQAAELATCDGFPVHRFAQLRGCAIEDRVTGREVVAELLQRPDLLHGHRLFFLVESEATATAVRHWARGQTSLAACTIEVAPPAFGTDQAYCDGLAARMAQAGSSLVFLCLGAPRSEVFALRYRECVRDCWMLCIGQSVRVALGVVREPPQAMVRLHVEWLWRLWQEPRRLLRRYVHGAIGFTLAAWAEMRRPAAMVHDEDHRAGAGEASFTQE